MKKNLRLLTFPILSNLNIQVHIDYIEQFLCDSNTRLPCLNKIYISYEQLLNVTENFTRSTTRINCAKLKHIIFHEK